MKRKGAGGAWAVSEDGGVGAPVGDGVAVELRRRPRPEAPVALGVEGRGRRDAEEEDRYPRVHQVAAVAAAVARHERRRGGRPRLARHEPAVRGAAPGTPGP